MQTFKQFLTERFISPGFKDEHDHFREKYKSQLVKMFSDAYVYAGGYCGIETGSEKETAAIEADVKTCQLKMAVRNDHVTAAIMYKPQHGRKAIGIATDGTITGKNDFLKIAKEDQKLQRSWAEVSGAPEKIFTRLKMPVVDTAEVEKIIGKRITIIDKETYEREISGHMHKKKVMGFPKT